MIQQFAKKHNLRTSRDECGEIIIRGKRVGPSPLVIFAVEAHSITASLGQERPLLSNDDTAKMDAPWSPNCSAMVSLSKDSV